MKIFITGATGFIGSHVANILSCQGHELVCLVRKYNEKSSVLANLGAKLVLGDLQDKKSLMHGMRGCDAAINIAAFFMMWSKNKRVYRDVNVQGTTNMMESVLESNLRKVIHVSSAVTYVGSPDRPFNEKSPQGPVKGWYAKTKYDGEQIVWNLYKNKGLPVAMIYPMAVLGPGDPKAPGRYVTDLANGRMPATVLNDRYFTWVHVNDVAEGIVKALFKADNIGERYFIGNHRLTMREFNQMISEVSGVPLPKITMPDFMVTAVAHFLTALSSVTGKLPSFGMAIDQINLMKSGIAADGSKAERELNLVYTPLRKAIEDEISSTSGDYMHIIKEQMQASNHAHNP